MPLDLSSIAKLEKNRLESDGAFVILLEIVVDEDTVIRVCRNTEDIAWDGKVWTAFPFNLDAPKTSGYGELPRFSVHVSNIQRAVEAYLEKADGGVGSTVRLVVVLVKKDGSVMEEPFLNEEFGVQSTAFDAEWISFTLSGATNLTGRLPVRRFLKNTCPFVYKGPECRASSAFASCDKSFQACRLRDNSLRFGGEPGIPQGGIYGA